MAETLQQRGPERATALVVLLAHVALVAVLSRLGAWGNRAQPVVDQLPPVVWLARGAQPTTAPAPTPTRRPAEVRRANAAAATASRSRPQAMSPTEPQAITPEGASADEQPSARTSAEAPAASAAPTRLNLSLPRGASAPWRQRSAALDDPRSNSVRATMETRLGAAMGDGNWVEERIDNDRVRFRRGNECVEVVRTRAGQIDLANGAFRELRSAKPC
jgi:hypothetical protein